VTTVTKKSVMAAAANESQIGQNWKRIGGESIYLRVERNEGQMRAILSDFKSLVVWPMHRRRGQIYKKIWRWKVSGRRNLQHFVWSHP